MITLYERDGHANILVNDLSVGHMIQANQHVIVHNGEGMVLDPGGHKVYAKLAWRRPCAHRDRGPSPHRCGR